MDTGSRYRCELAGSLTQGAFDGVGQNADVDWQEIDRSNVRSLQSVARSEPAQKCFVPSEWVCGIRLSISWIIAAAELKRALCLVNYISRSSCCCGESTIGAILDILKQPRVSRHAP
jgi:hypothetical protein